MLDYSRAFVPLAIKSESETRTELQLIFKRMKQAFGQEK